MFDHQPPFSLSRNSSLLEDLGISGIQLQRRLITFFKGQHPALPALAIWSKHIQEVVVMHNLETHTEFKVNSAARDVWLTAGPPGLLGQEWSLKLSSKGKHLGNLGTSVLFIQEFGCCADTGWNSTAHLRIHVTSMPSLNSNHWRKEFSAYLDRTFTSHINFSVIKKKSGIWKSKILDDQYIIEIF